jgi:(R,R)-butanediol dehydrogenase/meso-butanediol dehydrogenase/diacetyl reductase
MRAGLVTGKGRVELVEMPDPKPEPGKAVVEIAYCGICGTDVHAWLSGDPYNPAICGHEWVGTVAARGADVRNVKEGDRVVAGVAPACGACPACHAGDPLHCVSALLGMIGVGPLAAKHGGFARAIAVEAARLSRVPRALSDEDAALVEPATVAVHAVRRTEVRLGDFAVVLGAGPIGLLVLQCARAAGALRVIVVEPDESRGALALELGADRVLRPGVDDVAARVAEICAPLGPDVVFECAGVPATIQQSVSLVRRGGIVSLVGLASAAAQIDPGSWLVKEVRFVASLGYLHEEFDLAMALIADGRIRVAPLHTSTVGLDALGAAFAKLAVPAGEVKILVDPRRS